MKPQLVKSSDPRGLKRICLSCSTRFYDLNKRPISCPNCAAEYTGDIKIKTRRGRAAIPADAIDMDPKKSGALAEIANDDATEIAAEEETVSLDEVEALEDTDDAEEEAIDLVEEDLEDIDDLDDADEDDLDDDLADTKE